MTNNCIANFKTTHKNRQPFWFEADQNANKKGLHHTVFFVNGDQYIGDWDKNLKNGRGTMYLTSKGLMYEGDWKDDKRNGFGVLSVKKGKDSYEKIYCGGWKNNLRHGFGENWYSSNEFYEGEWYEGKRNGWGRMYFPDGNVYEGEWENDTMSGKGIMKNGNGNLYEGSWKNGMRNGEGKYYYVDKGQLLKGIWVNNVSKCGQLEDWNRDSAPNPTEFPMKELQLHSPYKVIKESEDHFLAQIP